MKTQSKLSTLAEVGQVLGAEVTQITRGGFVLELDTCEEATMSMGSLRSGTILSVGSKLKVEVVERHQGRNFASKIEVVEAK